MTVAITIASGYLKFVIVMVGILALAYLLGGGR